MAIDHKVDYWRELRNPRVLGTIIGFTLAILGLTNSSGNTLVSSVLGVLGLVFIFASIAPRRFLNDASKTIRRLQPQQRGKRIIAVVLIGLAVFSAGIGAGYFTNSYISAQNHGPSSTPTILVQGGVNSVKFSDSCLCYHPDQIHFAQSGIICGSVLSVSACYFVVLRQFGYGGPGEYSVYLPSDTTYTVTAFYGFYNSTSGTTTEMYCVPAPSSINVSHFTASTPAENFNFNC